jgi:hypothetical protein
MWRETTPERLARRAVIGRQAGLSASWHPGSERMTQRRYDGRDQDGARRHRPPSRRMLIAAIAMIVGSVVLTMVVATLLAAGW